MKKIVFLTTLLLLLTGLLPLMAQDAETGASGTYAVTVSLERVYPYRKGYVVKYRQGINKIADAYLPLTWFSGTMTKGEVILMGSGQDWPHLTVFYKEGLFDHVRLYVRKDRSHESWGFVPLDVNIDDKFEGVEELQLQF